VINKKMESPIRKKSDRTILELDPLSFIMKKSADPRLTKMPRKIIGMRIFIKGFY